MLELKFQLLLRTEGFEI